MNKKISFLILLAVVLVVPVIASAQLHSYGPAISYMYIVDQLMGAMWIIFSAIAVVCFIIAGILFLTANGHPEKLQSARSALIWGVVGVIIGIISYSIVSIVGSFI
ncbi:MAG: hypothetical protein NT155_03905 [Candidatus Staskawiczbacteria bacterium]|nr:hypothetical protein [Candidatus Staskawiczbacteria bacterium]